MSENVNVKFSTSKADSNGILYAINIAERPLVEEVLKIISGMSSESAKSVLESSINIIDSNSTVNKFL